MREGEELWGKYCSFFDKEFSEQLDYNETKLKEYFEQWKSTNMAKQLCQKGVERFEDVPLTTYEDYPILHEFGAKVEHLSKTVPRAKDELLWDYYLRISKQVAPMLDGWMVDEYEFCLKTSGSGGGSKWVAHGKETWKNAMTSMIALAIFACSDKHGETKLRKGDKILALTAPPPYGASVTTTSWDQVFECVPPLKIMENIDNVKKRFSLAHDLIEKGEKITFLCGVPSFIHLFTQYLTNQEVFYKDRYQSMHGVAKSFLYLRYLQSKGRKKLEKASDALPLDGIIFGGWDATLYQDYIKYHYDLNPLNLYGSTELPVTMFGRPHRKFNLFPNLLGAYSEFLAENGQVKGLGEVKKNLVYELVVTVFGSSTVRYKTDDLFRVIELEDDGMPVLSFEGRRLGMLDVYGYFNLTEAMVKQALGRLGIAATDDWSVLHELEPEEHLKLLMEKASDHSEEELSKQLVKVLQSINPYIRNYVKEFGIKVPTEIVKVEYLSKGAFARYTMKKRKEGGQLGQIKPPHLISPERREIADALRSV